MGSSGDTYSRKLGGFEQDTAGYILMIRHQGSMNHSVRILAQRFTISESLSLTCAWHRPKLVHQFIKTVEHQYRSFWWSNFDELCGIWCKILLPAIWYQYQYNRKLSSLCKALFLPARLKNFFIFYFKMFHHQNRPSCIKHATGLSTIDAPQCSERLWGNLWY
jgi:hypothetical protein